jgi:triosephosphate isomerase (TIM)
MLIIGNWKAYIETRDDAKELISTGKRLASKTKHRVVLLPPTPFLSLAGAVRTKLSFGAQDISVASAGAATGEVTGRMLKEVGASYVLIGHSERRARGENDALVREKVVRALSAGLVPVVCVGEKARDAHALYLGELRAHIDAVMSALLPKDRLKVVIAYEPIWAIGKSAAEAIRPADLAEMVLYIRKILGQYVPQKDVMKVKVLYGGSVEPGSVGALAKEGKPDGFLVGRASTEPKIFAALLAALS